MYFALILLLITSLGLSNHAKFLHSEEDVRILASSGDISLPTSFVEITSDLLLYFNFESNNTITIVVSYKIPNQYIGIGLGNRMFDADIWSFEIIGGQVFITDRKALSNYRTPVTDFELGCTDDLSLLGYDIQSNGTLIKFSRALDTGDSCDVKINQGLTRLIWSTKSGANKYAPHDSFGLAEANMTNGYQGKARKITLDTKTHGIMMVISWGGFFDLALLIVRYYKFKGKKPPFQYLHSIFMWVTYIISVVFIAKVIYEIRDAQGDSLTYIATRGAHGVIGFIILGLSTISMFGGIVVLNFLKSPKPNEISIAGKNNHKYLGYFIYLLTRINLIIGTSFMYYALANSIYVYMAVMFGVHIAMYIYHKKRTSMQVIYSEIPMKNPSKDHNELVKRVNQGESRDKLIQEYPKIKWVIFGNKILDLTGFIHPGGNFIIEHIIGREITPFLRGAFTIESKIKGLKNHNHSYQAFKFIEGTIIGILENESQLLIPKNKGKNLSAFNDAWTLSNKTKLSPTLSRFDFKCEDFDVKPIMTSYSGCGRHFTLKFTKNSSVIRTYTCAMALTEQAVQFRKILLESLEDKPLIIPQELFTSIQTLPLFIKRYNFPNGLSRAVHELDLNSSSNSFQIEGPFGRGLEISDDPDSKASKYMIICAGTGILPFLDFLNLYFINLVGEILHEKGKLDFAKEYEKMGINFEKRKRIDKIVLIGAFPNAEETYGLDIIEKIAFISNKFNKSGFKAYSTSIQSEFVSKFEGKINRESLNSFITKEFEKFYVCGPPKFNVEISETLYNLGINKSAVILL